MPDMQPSEMTDKEQTELAQIRETKCPACNHESLFVGKGEYITCGNLECQNPDYNSALLDWRDKAVREARIDEAERLLGYDLFGTLQRMERTNDAVNRRIGELKALNQSEGEK